MFSKLPPARPVQSGESGARGRKREALGAGRGRRGGSERTVSVDGAEDGVGLYSGGTTDRTC